MTLLLVFFAIAAVSDFLSVEWQNARERGDLYRLGVITALLGASHWAPVWWVAFTSHDISVAVSSIVGSVVGSVVGTVRYKKKKAANLSCLGCCMCCGEDLLISYDPHSASQLHSHQPKASSQLS